MQYKCCFSFLLIYIINKCNAQDTSECPPGYEEHPLVLVSMDGFRYDYLARGVTPTIQAFKDSGASAPFLKASYPTITFPNHYAIVTGLYPESHGIITNHFYDPTMDAYFDVGTNESLQSKWWGGDPIWNTVVKQGKISGTILWPGSDANVEEMHATYWYKYNKSMPFEDRVNQVLDWLTLPQADRPVFINVYFDQPDSNGHDFGPDSLQIDDALADMDRYIADLLDGIDAMNLTSCVNVIILSDHGMAESGNSMIIPLYDYVPNLAQEALVYEYSFVMMYINDTDTKDSIRSSLTCQQPEMRQFEKKGLPKRFHYSSSPRIGDIVLDLTVGYEGLAEPVSFDLDKGDHGYDNYYSQMQAVFMARGPEFLTGVEIETFQNIEIYNLLCYLVGVNPSPNNGTIGSLYHLLKNPPAYPSTPYEDIPVTAEFPDEQTLEQRLNISGCNGDLNQPEAWIYDLNMTDQAKNISKNWNLPWGFPHTGSLTANIVILYHEDHITGFSQNLKMPLWTSFTVDSSSVMSLPAQWSSDVRLSSDTTPTCQFYDDLVQQNITMEPLFSGYSHGGISGPITYLVSNAIPMTTQLKLHWKSLVDTQLAAWVQATNGPVNVVVGPLFDKNSDSLADNFTSSTSFPEVPTDLFLIATRCLSNVTDLLDCDSSALDAISFIYPEMDSIPNCLGQNEYTLMFSAKVKDVELATGLMFYPNLPYKDRIQLEIRIHSRLWAY